MVYIIFVNPQILAAAGMDKGAVFVATCIAAAVSTLVMALYANYPIALAPGMGLNAFFAFTVVLTYKYSWQQALAAVFLSGVLFFLLSVFRVARIHHQRDPAESEIRDRRGRRTVPRHHRASRQAKLVVDHPVDAGHARRSERSRPPILFLLGFVLIVALNSRKILGGTLIGILIVGLIGIPLGLAQVHRHRVDAAVARADFPAARFLAHVRADLHHRGVQLPVIDVFDNAGTLIGVSHRAGLLDKDGKLPRMKQALISDSFAAMFGALDRHLDHDELYRERRRRGRRRPHRLDRGGGRDPVPAGFVLLAARRNDPGLCARRRRCFSSPA